MSQDQDSNHPDTLPRVRCDFPADGRCAEVMLFPPEAVSRGVVPVLCPVTIKALIGALEQAGRWAEQSKHPLVHVMLTSGAPAFALGADLGYMLKARMEDDRSRALDYILNATRLAALLYRGVHPKAFTVAVVEGPALGGGLEVVLAADLRVVVDGPQAKLGLPEAVFGLFAGCGAPSFLYRMIGRERTMNLLANPATYSARALASEGVTMTLAENGEARKTAAKIMERHAQGAQTAIALRKVRDIIESDIHTELDAIARHWVDTLFSLSATELSIIKDILVRQAKKFKEGKQ